MAWTWPTGLFFIGIGLMLVLMTMAEIKWPGGERRGFLPMVTSRGDRLFISLLSAAWVHLVWLGLTALPLYVASIISLGILVVVIRWG